MPAARNITGGHRQPAGRGQRRGQQAALQRRGSRSVQLGGERLHRDRGTVGGELEQIHILVSECAGAQRAHMQDADDLAFSQQRGTHQRPDALLQQDGIDDLGVIDLVNDHRAALRRDPPGEAPPHRYLHALLDLFFQPARGRRHQLAGLAIQQQDRGGIGLQGLFRAVDQRIQQCLRIKHGQRRISDRLNIPQPLSPLRRHSHARRACSGSIFIEGGNRHTSPSGRTLLIVTQRSAPPLPNAGHRTE